MKIVAAFLLVIALASGRGHQCLSHVFVCMKTNGETQEMLRRCSCSIDVIASLLPCDRYVAAQTVAGMETGARPDRHNVSREPANQSCAR